MKTLTLRIKKVFLQKIRQGEKTIEYRNNSPFYRAVFKNRKQWTHLRLHYQNTSDVLIVPIKSIRLIKKPQHLSNSPFVTTDKVWAISIER